MLSRTAFFVAKIVVELWNLSDIWRNLSVIGQKACPMPPPLIGKAKRRDTSPHRGGRKTVSCYLIGEAENRLF